MRPVTLFAHMCPIYLNAGAAVVRARGGRTMLWFAHPSVTPTLVLAERLADAILTTLPESYPRASAKVQVIGQAVDVRRFVPPPGPVARPCRLLALGRTAPVKGYVTVVRGVAAARARGTDVSITIAGPSSTEAERVHRQELQRLIDDLGLAGVAVLEEGMPHDSVAGRLAQATALVNATSRGSADKAVFEAMACGRPVLFSNPALDALLQDAGLDLRFEEGDADSLGARLAALAGAPDERLQATGDQLRARVERGHSLDHWADSVVTIAASLNRNRTSPGGS
jgi:glycosyltransferase involved in cell wall biosynthesis